MGESRSNELKECHRLRVLPMNLICSLQAILYRIA